MFVCYLLVTALEPFSPFARGRSNRHSEDPERNETQEAIPGVKGKGWQWVPGEPSAACTRLGAPLEAEREDPGKGGTTEKNREVKKELVWEGKLTNSTCSCRICIIGKNQEVL